MNQLQKLKKEIQSTLDQEKSNIFAGHHDESNLQGWLGLRISYKGNRITGGKMIKIRIIREIELLEEK